MEWYMLCTNVDMLDLAVRKSAGLRPWVFGMHNVVAVKEACEVWGLKYKNMAKDVSRILEKAPSALIDYVHNPMHKQGWSIGIKVLAPALLPEKAFYTDDDVLLPNGLVDIPHYKAFATNGGMGGQVTKSSPKSRELLDAINEVMGTDLDPWLWWDKQCDVGVWNLNNAISKKDYLEMLFRFYDEVPQVCKAKRDSVFFRETDQMFFTALWHKLKLPDTLRPGTKTRYKRIISKPEKTFEANPDLHARHCREAIIIHYGASSWKRHWMKFLEDALPDYEVPKRI